MFITRKSPFSGEIHTKEIEVTQIQLDNWKGGMLIQNAFPRLSADEREFIKTGITKEEWDACFGV